VLTKKLKTIQTIVKPPKKENQMFNPKIFCLLIIAFSIWSTLSCCAKETDCKARLQSSGLKEVSKNIYITQDGLILDFNPYMRRMERKIKRAWNPPFSINSYKIVVIFTLEQTGKVSNLSIKESNAEAFQERAALKAIRKAAPFGRLPKINDSSKSAEVNFTFDYNLIVGY